MQEALNLLEQQTYIQRNGEVYEFLTDEEKDIEQEIKNTEVDTGDLYKVLEDIFFTDVVRDRKIRYDVTGQDFPFGKKLDDQLIGREQELAIHLITPLNENVDKIEILQANSLGRPELLVVLPPDSRLVSDLYLVKEDRKIYPPELLHRPPGHQATHPGRKKHAEYRPDHANQAALA